MGLTRRVLVTCCVLTTAAAATGCEYDLFPFDPCPGTTTSTGFEEIVEDVGQMDWIWTLAGVNGTALPFTNPDDFDQTVTKLNLHFDTDATERASGDCADVTRTSGTVVAVMTLRTNGVNSTERFTGTFRRDHKKNTTSLFYGKFELPLQRTGAVFTTTPGQVIGPVDREKVGFVLTRGFLLRFDQTRGPGLRSSSSINGMSSENGSVP